MATNPDFEDLLSASCAEGAEFIIVGAHAVMFYTVPRYTKDLDVWVRPTLRFRALMRDGGMTGASSIVRLTIK